MSHSIGASLAGIFRDDAVIYGIKFGLAGVLAIFLALVVKLEEPTWALFTVYVLMIAQYVGAIAEKSVFRLIGTAIGGIIGYVLTASLQQSPIIYLSLIGLVVGVSTAMFGQSRYPYAFLLCGMTTVVVTSNGLGDPDNSWKFMLWRIEEVGLGIIVTVLVQCLVFPRYARQEFVQNAQSAFADLKDCFVASASIFLKGGNPGATARAEGFPARISALRALLDFGGRESQNFRDRQPTYFAITSCLSNIAAAIVTLGQALPEKSIYRSVIGTGITTVHESLASSLQTLGKKGTTAEMRRADRETLDKAFALLEEQLLELRKMREVFTVAPQEAMTMGLHILALDDIRQQIHKAHELLDSLPLNIGQITRDPEPFVSPVPPIFWIHSGIKAGISVVLALVIDNWLNPPGGSMFVLGAWVFTAMNASSPGGQGDRKAFLFVIYNTVALLALSLILILSSPMLSSYAVMNTVIFTWLFVWGYLSYTIRGVNQPMQVGMLASVGLLGLNGQQPVPFQAIAGLFFGIVLSQCLAAIVQRLLWPSLPQWEMRNRFVEFTQVCVRLIKNGPETIPLWQKVRIAVIPGEVTQRIAALGHPMLPEGESQRLRDYLLSLQKIGNHLIATAGKLAPLLPSSQSARGTELIHKFEEEMVRQLQAHEKAMETSSAPVIDTTAIPALINAWQEWLKDMRAWMLAQEYPILEAVRIYGFCGRYEQVGQDLINAEAQARQLRLPLYMGDYIL